MGGTHHLWPRSFVHRFRLPASAAFQPFCFVNTHAAPDDSAHCFPSGFTTGIRAAVQGKVKGAVLHHVKTMSFVLLGRLATLRQERSHRRSKAKHRSHAASSASSGARPLARCILHEATVDTWDPARPSPPAAFQHSWGCPSH